MNLDEIHKAKADHPIHELFARRWSPYAYSDKPVSDADLRSLFEASRWAASSYNEQPWSYIVATKADPEAHAKLLSCLVEGNQAWAAIAPVLAIGCTSLHFKHNGKRNAAAEHDLGAASFSLALQAVALGLHAHQMIGIHPDRVRELYKVPEGVEPLTGIAVGYLGDINDLPENIRGRDTAAKPRKPLAEFVFGEAWGTTSPQIG
ncbi:nitroreductase family protein [Paludisphaera rhizosphaerae]|uniref:nitroreductase family protein n=1 Tax=Paludisphaera rhizosphaerae TaxID=2711216 RepID=UPI001981C869|nr:nitroreductase family protein [Paludisphaera rhizosphaerae]